MAVAVTGAQVAAQVISQTLPLDLDLIRDLYAEEVAAYLDGVALLPGDGLAAAIATLAELDPGKAITLDALRWPEEPGRLMVHEENLVVRDGEPELLTVRGPQELPII